MGIFYYYHHIWLHWGGSLEKKIIMTCSCKEAAVYTPPPRSLWMDSGRVCFLSSRPETSSTHTHISLKFKLMRKTTARIWAAFENPDMSRDGLDSSWMKISCLSAAPPSPIIGMFYLPVLFFKLQRRHAKSKRLDRSTLQMINSVGRDWNRSKNRTARRRGGGAWENRSVLITEERWEKWAGRTWERKGVVKEGEKEKKSSWEEKRERSGEELVGKKENGMEREAFRAVRTWARCRKKGGMEFAEKDEPRRRHSCQGVCFSLKTSLRLCFATSKASLVRFQRGKNKTSRSRHTSADQKVRSDSRPGASGGRRKG